LNNNENSIKKTLICITETIIVNFILFLFIFKKQANQEVYLFLNPNPLLFLSIIMGLRYGLKLGLFSSLISCAFYIYAFFDLYNDFSLFYSSIEYYKYPLLFLWSGAILGAFKDNHRREINKLNNDYNMLKLEKNDLEADYILLEKIEKELKTQIIKSDESIISLYEIATKLETFEEEDIYTETIGVLKKYLKATNITLYTYEKESNYLRLKISYGVILEKTSIDASKCEWFKKVKEIKDVVKIPYVTESSTNPLMSAPLIRDNEIIAIVNINKMDFDMLSEYAYNLFQLIIQWINRTLQKAAFVEKLVDNKYIENTKLVTAQHFRKRFEIEKRRKNEFGIDYCILSYRVVNLTLEELDKLCNKTLRNADIAYYNINRNTLSFLLPATKKSNSFLIIEKINNNFQDHLKPIELKILED